MIFSERKEKNDQPAYTFTMVTNVAVSVPLWTVVFHTLESTFLVDADFTDVA